MQFTDDEPCPCQSGKVVGNCVCKLRNFVPLPVTTLDPHGVVTGRRVRGCYAQTTNNCLAPLSAEHPIAESISTDFQDSPIIRTLSDGKKVTIKSSTAGVKVLCKRHNSALSPLDQVGRRFLQSLAQQIHDVRANISQKRGRAIYGFDVERWMLKSSMCNGTRPKSLASIPFKKMARSEGLV